MRKRRKIVIDNEATELTSGHIKAMLHDQTDILLQDCSHPADWIQPQEKSYNNNETHTEPQHYLLLRALPYERLLARPGLGDDGALAPELLNVWGNNVARLAGKPNLIRMRGTAGEAQRRERAEQVMEQAAAQEEEEESVELGRHSRHSEGPPMMEDDADLAASTDYNLMDDEPHLQQDDDLAMQLDDDAFEQPHLKDEIQVDFDDRSLASHESSFYLGAVNDALGVNTTRAREEDENDPRQAAGTDLILSNTKWHKHTVKVMGMLKRNMGSSKHGDIDADGDVPENKSSQLSYNKLSHGCSRRTAAGVFFELLQLKTWDFIELEQDESYGDITVTPGAKYNEDPPSK